MFLGWFSMILNGGRSTQFHWNLLNNHTSVNFLLVCLWHGHGNSSGRLSDCYLLKFSSAIVEHEAKQVHLRALRNRQDLFQQEGVLSLILDTIDKISALTNHGFLSNLQGEYGGWDEISSYLYLLIGEGFCVVGATYLAQVCFRSCHDKRESRKLCPICTVCSTELAV